MASKVKFEIISGGLRGTKFGIDERMTCIVGRGKDCNLRIPMEADGMVSRHHCILDINPPEIVVRDLGSSNGTFVNGQNICTKRDPDNESDNMTIRISNDNILNHNDKIKIGDTVIIVHILEKAKCCDCEKPLLSTKLSTYRREPGRFQCDICYLNSQKSKIKEKGLQSRGTNNTQILQNKDAGDTSIIIGNIRNNAMLSAVSRNDLKIHGYKLIKELGRGGMGVVFLAEDERDDKQVALKIMLPKSNVTQNSLDSFLREMDNTRVLDHQNIVNVMDSGYSHGSFYLTMEYCNEGDVCDFMDKLQRTFTVEEALGITSQILDGLEYAHNAKIPCVKLQNGAISEGIGLIHRDIKPENIFISTEGEHAYAKIADFGLAKAFDFAGLSGCTRTGDAGGTPYFMSRSQLIDFKYSKPDIDVWGVAATLYFMLTNEFPRDFDTKLDPLAQLLETDPVPIQQRDSTIPDKLAEVIDLALRDNGELHFKTALEFKSALNDACI
jgi:pSer/pThr/pTyr-binding forkhead associated (FHA) protein